MMAKDQYQLVLPACLDAQLAGNGRPLDEYLAANSNLPGPAGNFTLLHALTELLVARVRQGDGRIWQLLADWAALPAVQAPANHPREFLPFAAALAHGAIAAELPDYWLPALSRLRAQARDPRWRTRETVAQGLQAMARVRFDDLRPFLFDLVAAGDALDMRAAAAAIAEPDIVANPKWGRVALDLHVAIVEQVLATPLAERRAEPFRALRQGLGYTLSVVVAGLPVEGFAIMRAWCQSPDADLRWLLKENLKKNRLVRPYPAAVAEIAALLAAPAASESSDTVFSGGTP